MKVFPRSSRKRKGKGRKYVYCCVRYKCKIPSESNKEDSRNDLEEMKVLHETERKKRKIAERVANNYYREWTIERKEKDKALANQVFTTAILPPSMYIRNELLHCSENSKERVIGSGSFGTVTLCKYKGDFVAVKSLKIEGDETETVIRRRALHEAKVLLNLKCHQSVPTLLGVSVDANPAKLIMQFYGVGSKSLTLHSLCKSTTQLISNEVHWHDVIRQIAGAIEHVHNCGFIHNDIKTNNVVIYENNENVVPVLIDFGKACRRDLGKTKSLKTEEQNQYLHKYKHIAPEVVNGTHKQSTYSDVYSFGYLVYQIVSSPACQHSKALKRIVRECYEVKTWHCRASLAKVIWTCENYI